MIPFTPFHISHQCIISCLLLSIVNWVAGQGQALPPPSASSQTQPAPSSTPHISGGNHPLTGTWSSGVGAVLTGSDFVNVSTGIFNVPQLTGISYSFTDDGYYEEAVYRQISNGTYPQCIQGILIWQHGTYTKDDTMGSLTLSPIPQDGLMEIDNPCESTISATVMKYNQTEYFIQWKTFTDINRNVYALQLYQWDGTPLAPMYLRYESPHMQPTTNLTSNGTFATTKVGSAYSFRPIFTYLFISFGLGLLGIVI